jgi:hypothetical protein
MAPEFGVGSANYSLQTFLGKFQMVNGISTITDVTLGAHWQLNSCGDKKLF